MKPVRLGAVAYLNARPLVYGLEIRTDLFALRFDVPSKCAALLHEGSIDLGMIPSIEYLQSDAYRIVPDLAIVSRGAVASVALFTTRPVRDVRSIAMDSSSRTSVALVRILCGAARCSFRPTPPAQNAPLNGPAAAAMSSATVERGSQLSTTCLGTTSSGSHPPAANPAKRRWSPALAGGAYPWRPPNLCEAHPAAACPRRSRRGET